MFIKDGKRFNPYIPFVDSEGTTYANPSDPAFRGKLGIEEIPDPQPPEEFSDDAYFRTECDEFPYVIYTRKPDEMIKATKNGRLWQQITSLETAALIPRQLREFLLAQPDADKAPWYIKVKELNDAVTALKAQLQ